MDLRKCQFNNYVANIENEIAQYNIMVENLLKKY